MIRAKYTRALVPAAILGGVATAIFLRSVPQLAPTTNVPVAFAATSTPAPPFEYHALDTEQKAIDRALELFPDKSPTQVVARITTRLDAVTWRNDGATPEPGSYDSTKLANPAWIVGIKGTGVNNCDIVPLDLSVDVYGRSCDPSTTLYGIYYILNPPDAMVITVGELTSAMHSSLASMSNGSFSISFETPMPLSGATLAATPPYSVPQIVTSTPEPSTATPCTGPGC